MLQAYSDDSGTHEASPVCLLAGYFGSERQWVRFDREWRKVLDREELEEFHANRFWSHVKGSDVPEYRGWNKEKDDQFITSLLKVIEDSDRIFPVSCSVVKSEWSALTKDERTYLTGGVHDDQGNVVKPGAPNKPYFLPFLMVIRIVAEYCNWGHLVHFYFDLNKHFSGYALEYFKEIKKLEIDDFRKLGEISFPDSKRATPLQAADLLAYESYQYELQRLEAEANKHYPSEVLRRALRNLRNMQNDSKMFDRQGFDITLETFRKRMTKKP